MKILHYCNNLGSGGAEKLLTDILPIMHERGHEVSLLLSNGKANVASFEEKLKKEEIKVINLNTSFYNPLQVLKVISLLRQEQYDIVHAHLFPTQYWLAFASLFSPQKTVFIKTEHSVFNERKKYALLRPLEKWIYSRYRSIIGITDLVKENLSQWIKKKKKIEVIKNGVNLKEIQNGGSMPWPNFLDKSYFNILMVARFDFFQKDQKTLLEALPLLPNKGKYRVYFAGEGPNREPMEALSKELGIDTQVTFLGLRQDVYSLMNKVDLNILSTKHEGLSGVTLESLASGTPFLGSDVVGVNDVVPHQDYLFPCGDAKELARKIHLVKTDAAFRDFLLENAREYIKGYDIPIMAGKYLSLYEKALTEE